MANADRRPVYEALRRRNVRGALWKNEGENGQASYGASLSRSRKTAKGDWVSEVVYASVEDIARMIGVLRELESKAYELMQADYEAGRAER